MGPEVLEQHKQLQMGIGEWAGTISMYQPEMKEPEVAPCSEVVTAIGELWTTSRFEMDFMGSKFVGSGTLGYDSLKKKYVGTWIDSMNPTITAMEGEFDEAKQAMVMHYDMYDPMTKSMTPMRNEMVHKGDSYSLSFFKKGDADEALYMKIDMKRK